MSKTFGAVSAGRFLSVLFVLFALGCASARVPEKVRNEALPITSDVAQETKPPIQFSESCREWRSISADDSLRTGFYRKEGTTVYVEKESKVFLTLEGKSAPFFSDSSSPEWSFTATASGFNGLEKERNLGSPLAKPLETLRDFLAASVEMALRTQNSNRWISILLESETKFAVVLQGDVCAAAPKARYVTCSVLTRECGFFPKSFELENENTVSRACLADLKMGEPSKIQPLVKACEYFQSSAFEERRRFGLQKAAQCGAGVEKAIQSLPNLKRIEKACESVPDSLLELTRSR